MSIIRNRLYQFKQELLSNKDRAWYSHTNLLTAVDLLITDLDNLDESDWTRRDNEADMFVKMVKRLAKGFNFKLCDRIRFEDPETGKKYL